MYAKAANGSGREELLLDSEHPQIPTSWAPDGLIYEEVSSDNTADIWILPLEGTEAPTPLVETQFDDRSGMISPDGRWLAYVSNRSGRYEVYLQPYPGSEAPVWESTRGGVEPVWSSDGRQLFFRAGDVIMAVTVDPTPDFPGDGPRVVLDELTSRGTGGLRPNYDVFPDGSFLMAVREGETAPNELYVVVDWFEELRQRMGEN
jgi:hypothetical protein